MSTLVAASALIVAAGVLLAAGSLVGLALLDGEGTVADRRTLEWVETHRTPAVVSVARVVTALLDLIGFLLIAGLLVVVTWWRTRRADLPLMIAVTILGAQVLESAIKQITDRPRPDGGLVFTATSAFPSGHSSRAMVCALLTAWLLAWGGQRLARRLAAGAVILLGIAVGVSRVILQAHWATDVITGLILGAMWFGVVLLILRPTAQDLQRAGGAQGHSARSASR